MILAFGVLPANGTGNPAIILVLVTAMISTVALWKWGGARRVSGQQPDGQQLGAEQDTATDRQG